MKQTNTTAIAVLIEKVIDIKSDLKRFVTLDRFQPIEKIVWTAVILTVTAVVGALLKLIFIP